MVKKIIFFICIVILSAGSFSFGQETKKQFIHKGLLRAQGTIAPGIMLKENTSTISIHGNLEYYASDDVSVRGDSYYFLNDDQKKFSANHSILAGASYHLKTKSHFDPYIGFQPGIAIASRSDVTHVMSDMPLPDYYAIAPKPQLCPLISPVLGFNFYFQRVFHLFMEARYIAGKYLPDDGDPVYSLSELRFSFGLGFNLSVFKQKQALSTSE